MPRSVDGSQASWRARFRTALACVFLGAWLVVGPGRGPFAAADPGVLAGRVVDKSGGVAGARVWALNGSDETCKVVAETITDEDGRFSFYSFWNDPERAGFDTVTFLARDRSGRTGWRSNVSQINPPVDPIEVAESVEFSGRLIDQAGRPIAGVEVLPTMFARSPWVTEFVYLSRSVARRHAGKTDRNGAFTLRNIPEHVAITVTVEAPAFGSPSICWESTQPVDIGLDGRLGRVRGRIAPNVEPGPDGRLRVIAFLDSGGNLPRSPYAIRVLRETHVLADGTFQFDVLPPGRYSISAATTLGGPYSSDPLNNVKVDPGAEVAGVEIKVRRLPVITGRVVDASSGKGLAGVHLVAERGENPYAHSWLPMTKTDSEGRYRVSVSPDIVRVVPGPTKTHTGLRSDVWPRMRVDADQEWPDLKMARAAVVDGIAIDGAGRPVPGAKVFLITRDNLAYGLSGPTTVSRSDGTFRLEQLYPDDTVSVLARTTVSAAGGPVTVRPGKQQGRLSLTMDATLAYHIRGTVTDQAGEPIEGARVLLWWARYPATQGQRRGVSGGLEDYTTDVSGRFVSGALWPGERYKVTVDAEGYGRAESPEVTGHARDERDFGRIMLVDTSGYVAGTVVDSAGKPFPGASIFNRGDAPAPVEIWTDKQGRFRLYGLFPGGKYVFARAAGYRIAGVRIEGNVRDVRMRLRRDIDPPSPWKPAESPSYEAQRAFADRIVTRLWARYGKDADRNGASACVFVMARIDPKRALAWSAEHGGRYDAEIRRVAASRAAETDAKASLDDRSRTIDLIDRALALSLDRPGEFIGFGGATLSAAWAAVDARHAGYPDMESVVARVLAARSTDPNHDVATQVRSAAAVAAVLALIDPATARQVLRDAESRSGLDSARLAVLARDRWLMAWAMVDTEHAQALVDAELTALESRGDVDLRPTGFFKMAEVLATSPARRDEFLRGEIGSASRPAH